ncbi:hypothetical protein NCCP28_06320 [Niallia sp. NCCP-28]|nr:hypothetical protein NCCP28_06320 [Niallia sp. NCCP-28]
MNEMNAAEMRKKSTENRYKVATANLEQFINGTNENIKSKASDGHFSYMTPIPNEPLWNEYECTESVANYYRNRGFKVTVDNYNFKRTMIISWLEEGDENIEH